MEVPWNRAALLSLSEVHGQGVVIYLYQKWKGKKHHLPHHFLRFNKDTINKKE
jgi:hypothetical protein